MAAYGDRKDVPVGPWRNHPWLVELYALTPEGDEYVQSRLGPVMRNEVRSEGVQSRIREACLHIEANREAYDLRAWICASSILRMVGSKTGRAVSVEGGRKAVKFTVYPETLEEKEYFAEVAAEQGLSLAAWTLSVLRSAAEAANKGV